MAQPYVGEIRMFAGNFAPAGWAICNGQQIPISENDTLFNLIGTTYGGDGRTTFAVPDLRGRAPMHYGNGYVIGQVAGTENVTLTTQQIPAHTHGMQASGGAPNSTSPTNSFLGTSSQVTMYFGDPPNVNMNANAISAVGGNQPHENMQPYLVINYIISLYGLYPSQT